MPDDAPRRQAQPATLSKRFDMLVDKLLESKADAHARDLCGKIAVANAKLAYQSMKRIFAEQR
jgi:hypothetical protein